MMRTLILSFLLLSLSGCFGSLSLKNQPKADRSFYVIDSKFNFFCVGNTSECLDFTQISSASGEFGPIEHAYDQKIAGPNYPANLMRMIMSPLDKSYTAKPYGENGRYFTVPKNKKTDIVWNTLEEIHAEFFFKVGSS